MPPRHDVPCSLRFWVLLVACGCGVQPTSSLPAAQPSAGAGSRSGAVAEGICGGDEAAPRPVPDISPRPAGANRPTPARGWLPVCLPDGSGALCFWLREAARTFRLREAGAFEHAMEKARAEYQAAVFLGVPQRLLEREVRRFRGVLARADGVRR